jgi:hypothetical protein
VGVVRDEQDRLAQLVARTAEELHGPRRGRAVCCGGPRRPSRSPAA